MRGISNSWSCPVQNEGYVVDQFVILEGGSRCGGCQSDMNQLKF